jgi:predicted RND superfamily exporter protein
MSEAKTKKWSDDAVAALDSAANRENPVSADTVRALAKQLDVTDRSVAAKLRQLGHAVASMAAVKAPTFTDEQAAALRSFVESNANNLTYKQIAEGFQGGAFTAKQVQGKLLAMELTGLVKAAEKVEAVRTYSETDEAKFISLVNAGKFIEEIAEALNRTIASVRGKALSLTRSGAISSIPAQKESHAKNDVDPVEALGDAIATMTVADIAAKTGKSERGIKTLLTRRGIKVADHDGAAKKEKAEGKRAAA